MKLEELLDDLETLYETDPGVLATEDGMQDIYGVTPPQLDALLKLARLAVEARADFMDREYTPHEKWCDTFDAIRAAVERPESEADRG